MIGQSFRLVFTHSLQPRQAVKLEPEIIYWKVESRSKKTKCYTHHAKYTRILQSLPIQAPALGHRPSIYSAVSTFPFIIY